MMLRKMVGATALLATWMGVAGTVHTYTTAQTVDEVISGDDSVVVSCPAGSVVVFTGANTFTGGTTITSGGVEIANRSALGTGAINCASGTYVNVSVSWRGQATTLTEDVISKIAVAQPAAGEPWVAMRLTGDGLRNDVDFTGQPHLWLCSLEQKVNSSQKILQGIYEPCSNRYQFGYGGTQYNASYTGICVTNLVDAPNGDPREVLCRGKGTTTFTGAGRITFTGPLTVEDGAYIAVGSNSSFGKTKSTPSPKLVLREGTLYRSCAASISHNENFGLVVEGNATMHICGAQAEVYETFKGPFSGSGTLTVTDYGGLALLGSNTTFSGTIKISGTVRAAFPQSLYIGGGSNGVWNAIDVQLNNWPHGVVFTGDDDLVFSSNITGSGARIIKQGKGTTTIASSLGVAGTGSSYGAGQPFLLLKKGALKLDALQTGVQSGVVEIAKDTVLDLGGLSWPSFALPSGEGVVENWSGTLRFVNTARSGLTFRGWLGGTFDYDSPGAWTIQGTKDMGGMVVSRGKVTLAPGTVFTNTVTVATMAELDFGEKLSRPTGSLVAEYWIGGDSVFTNRTTALPVAYAFKHANGTFNYVGDTASFATCETTAKGCLDTGSVDLSPRTLLPILAGIRDAGSTSTAIDRFAVCYSGYFIAPTNGQYRFDGHADDALSVWIDGAQVLYNTSGSIGGGDTIGTPVELEAGPHPIEVYFVDITSAELFTLKVKTPLDAASHSLPLSMLSTQDYRWSAVADLAGSGRIGLAAGGEWPETLGLTNFTGSIVASANTAGDVGRLTVGDATIAYAGLGSMLGSDWSAAGRAELTNVNGSIECSLVPGNTSNVKGFYNSNFLAPVDKAWTLDFDMYGTKPRNPSAQYGDGFGVFLHTLADTALPSATAGWGFGSPGATCYGIQLYMMNGVCPCYWVKGGVRNTGLDSPGSNVSCVTNRYFHFGTFMDKRFHVRCAYDTSKMVVTLTDPADATKVFALTNLNAGTELQAAYPNGAKIGIWAACGAYYNCMRIADLSFDDGRSQDEGDLAFDGELELTGGTVNVVGSGTVDACTFGPRLTVKGATTFNVSEGLAPSFDGSLLFDFTAGTPSLAFTGGLDFGSDALTVDCLGVPPLSRTPVADFSGVTGTKPTAFAFPQGADSHWRLEVVDDVLRLWYHIPGATIYFR